MKRLLTKEDRLRVQAADFASLEAHGYTKEVWKGLIFWSKDEGKYFSLKTYKENAAHPIDYRYYRSEQERAQVIANYKANFDRRAEYKAEQKSKGKQLSNQAQAAQAIREELKQSFPGIKFKVTSEGYSMGDHVNISWEDGPTTEQVKEHTGKYQFGHFNGMDDIYENSNSREDIPQSKYVFESRSMSEATKETLHFAALELWPNDDERDRGDNLRRIWNKSAIPTGAKVIGIQATGRSGSLEDFYSITYEGGTAPEPIKQTNVERVEVEPGTIQIIEYGRGLAVIGETKPIKDILGRSGLGLIFQPRLSCGPGWIAPKSRLKEIEEAIKNRGKSGLREEINKTVLWLEQTDIANNGQVSAGVIEAATVQGVKLLTA